MMEEDSAGFGELLQQAEQLTAEIDDTGLPRVTRNLKQIVEEGQQLWSRTALLSAKDTNEVKASILLGSRGFDLPRASQKLEGLAAVPTFEPIEEARETDIQAFLRNERENAILSVFAESIKATQEEVDRFCYDAFANEWQREKQRVLDSLLGPSNDVMDVSTAAADTSSMVGSSFQLDTKTRSAMSAAEMPYAREVARYNDQVISGGTRPKLAERFRDVAKELDDRSATDMWDMVCFLLDAPLSATSDVQRTCALVSQSRKHLERIYQKYMRFVIDGNRGYARLGGELGTVNLVKSFLNVKLPAMPAEGYDGKLERHPVWALIYYCLRCGDREAAVEISRQAPGTAGELTSVFEEYAASADGHLGASSENRIRLQYARSVRASEDPFKRAVFCILGRCDVAQDHALVSTTCEDYLWLKLCLVYAEEPPSPGEEQQEQARDHLTLSKLQRSLLEEYGESHFDAMRQPYLYFQVLFLTGQFEHAVEFLARMEPQRVHAVHVALVLYEENLLTPPACVQQPLVSKPLTGPGLCFNLARLVTSYTRKFEASDSCKALGYFYFLRKLKGLHGENLFAACVSELVLETKEFEALLGKIEPDGCRRRGEVDKFNFDTERVIEAVAADCESRGLYEEAVRLYDLCGKHEDAIRLLCRLLAQHVPSASGPAWERLRDLAIELATRYQNHTSHASAEALSSLCLLLDLGTFFNLTHQHKTALALDTMRQLRLVPFNPSHVEESVAAFSRRSEDIRRILADILLAVMNLLYGQYKEIKGPDEVQKRELRSQARAIIMFAGSIPYRMPGDTTARLVQMEVLMC
ncbi:nuclear pore complex protein Nup93-like [Dermacentor variabilis]|uniref:nuclear pore complex protein Nup93-like n=1 Tax=Dermacentor variabilis TaxID=34621 RepID=UPI003F5C077B